MQVARDQGREVRHLASSAEDKQQAAREIAGRDRIRDGLIGVLTATEPCISFPVRRDREQQKIALERAPRKCLHLYHDFDHPRFGLMHVRLQTWFPFGIQVCLNGHEWLGRQLKAAGIGFVSRDNCICQVDDIDAAQALYDEPLRVSWPELLGERQRAVHPAQETLFANCPPDARNDYWSVAESEWSTDVLFRHGADVLPLTEQLVRASLLAHGPGDVLRFMGRTTRADGFPRASFGGTLKSNVKTFHTGLRIKHWLNSNSAKMPLSPVQTTGRPGVLRFETTINDPTEFKVFRTRENQPDAAPEWLRMRQGVADLHRRAEVSQAVNDRYATALVSAINDDQTLKELTSVLCAPVIRPGREQPDGTRARSRRFRALNPLAADDLKLLTAVARPEFTVSGLRNQHLREIWFGADTTDPAEQRRRASAVSRQLSLLRAPGILEKVCKSHSDRVTEKGRLSLSALLAAASTTTNKLNQLAA